MNESTAYQEARLIWSQGEPIPLDLAFTLMNEGYNVEFLEAQYLDN